MPKTCSPDIQWIAFDHSNIKIPEAIKILKTFGEIFLSEIHQLTPSGHSNR
jgi:hypothetical protein